MKKILLFILFTFSVSFIFSQKNNKQNPASSNKKETVILPAAYRTDAYVPLLKGKRVAVFANNTATISSTHLVDSLLKLGVHIVKAFGPEHGFRGNMDDGKRIDDYGNHIIPYFYVRRVLHGSHYFGSYQCQVFVL